jgi:hypothetical protein
MDATPLVIRRQIFRLNKISRVMAILEELRITYKENQSLNDKHNNLWGELDWLDELHRLLYYYDMEIDELVGQNDITN